MTAIYASGEKAKKGDVVRLCPLEAHRYTDYGITASMQGTVTHLHTGPNTYPTATIKWDEHGAVAVPTDYLILKHRSRMPWIIGSAVLFAVVIFTPSSMLRG